MKFKGYFEDVLGTPERVRLLQLFLRFPGKGFTANEAAGLIEISPMGAWRILKKFYTYGLVMNRRVGKSDDWHLRPDHLLVKKLQVLAQEDALDEMSRLLVGAVKGTGVYKLVLFGSVARHEERPDSDIDVLVLVKTLEEKEKVHELLLDLSLKFIDLFANRLAPVIFTEKEFKEKQESGLVLLAEIKKDGVVLFERR